MAELPSTPTATFAPIAFRPASAARAAGVSRRTLVGWIRDGKLRAIRPSVRMTLILADDLRAALEAMRGKGTRDA
ncbi:hypothetical protein PHYC_00485 [Phycisphaerales bacterium]|nr:hypothetical protein PHYC_00485 [Phycisphaerales bacterium]